MSKFEGDNKMKKETKLLLISLGCVIAGLLLIWLKPEFWLITSIHTRVLGTLLVLTGVMWAMCFIYSLLYKKNK